MEAKDFEFTMGHVGIWNDDPEEARKSAERLQYLFDFPVQEVSYAYYINKQFEILKEHGRGEKGHFSIKCNDVEAAKEYLESKGVVFDEDTKAYLPDGRLRKVFAHDSISGFDWHLVLPGEHD